LIKKSTSYGFTSITDRQEVNPKTWALQSTMQLLKMVNKTVNKNRNKFFTNASLLQQRTTAKNIYKEQQLQQLTKTAMDNVSKQQQQQQQHQQWGQHLQ